MDNSKLPFLPEETLRTQRVEVYLNDLKERLKELRLQHDEVIQNSVSIIKEIDEVSSSLLLPQNSSQQQENITKIKKLIQEFETAKEANAPATKTPVAMESKVDIRKILQNFEKLNESHVLKESLVLFKRAKESFEKIDTFFGRLNNTDTSAQSTNSNHNNNTTSSGISSSLRNKILMFNGGNDRESQSRYASCSSSVMSIDIFHSTEDLTHHIRSAASPTNSMENGYDGDNDDSEYDLLTMKKKKSNRCVPNM